MTIAPKNNGPSQAEDFSRDHRRTLVLVLSLGLLAVYGFGVTLSNDENFKLLSEMSGRIGLFLGALWIAWPSLQRPAQWLPPGIAMMCLMAMVVLAAQPKLRVIIVPVIAALIAVGVVVKIMRVSRPR